MSKADPELIAEAERFADDIADLLERTVSEQPPIRALAVEGRVLVAPFAADGDQREDIPLTVQGERRLDLRLEFRCAWDFARKFLAIESSRFALKLPHLGEPLIRFDYLRSHTWAPAHVQMHAESSTLGYLHAFTGTVKPPKVQALHIPVGGRRLRPCLEDVIDFAIHDLAVDARAGASARIGEGRSRWKRLQVNAAIRDVIKHDPDTAPHELRATIEQAVADVADTTAAG
ncbi:MAG: hypothetical protein WD638_04060 [Nitriliruptoraceae bacterium]